MDSKTPPMRPLLIYINLPSPDVVKFHSKSHVLLRHLVAHQLRKMYWSNKDKAKERALSGCMCNVLPSSGKRKDGTVYQTGMPGRIEIHHYAKESDILEANEKGAKHSYVGMQRCGSALRCPVCGARIRHVRRGEIQEISRAMINAGFSFVFQTLTAPHEYGTDPKDFIKKFQEANRQLKKTRSWKLFSERWKVRHYVRGVEVTDDHPDSKRKSGIHFHNHSIIFLERDFLSEKEAKRFRDELAALWCRALRHVGLISETDRKKTFKHGVHVGRPKVKIQGELSNPDLIKELIEYVCKGASFEMSPGTVSAKNGRKASRISHWELMRLALTERQYLQPRLFYILQALKGLAHLQFSRGLKAFCGIDEVSDKEIVEGKKEILVYAFDSEDSKKLWKTIKKNGQQKPVLVAIDEGMTPEMAVEVAGAGCSPLTGELLLFETHPPPE